MELTRILELQAGLSAQLLQAAPSHLQVPAASAHRAYFDKNSAGILKKLREGDYKVADLAQELKIDEDGTRAILYLLSENGDVSEKKRDIFTIA